MRLPLSCCCLFLAACGPRLVDPCAGIRDTCLALQVDRAAGAPDVDALAVTLAGDDGFHAAADPAENGRPLSFPVAVGVVLPPLPRSPLALRASVTGTRGGRAVATGAASATVTSGQHQTVHLSLDGGVLADLGTGDDGALAASSLSIDGTPGFGTVTVGATASQTFIITNHDAQAIGAPQLALGDGTHFRIVDDGCTQPLAALGSCTVTVQFAPAQWGAHTTDLTARATPGGNAQVQLDGVGQDFVTLAIRRVGDVSNHGAVTADGDISDGSGSVACGPTCTVQLARAAAAPTLTLTATPNATTSQPAAAWSGCDATDGNQCVITVRGGADQPTTVTATFALKTFTWTFVASAVDGASGSIGYPGGTCPSGGHCNATLHYGDAFSYSAAPASGSNAVLADGSRLPWAFAGWSGGPCAGATDSPCNVASVTASAQVTSTFSPYNVMFVTSDNRITPGALGTLDPLAGNDGFRGADARCQALADASSLPAVRGKIYKAFLASANQSIDARARLFNSVTMKQPRAWVRPDGRPFSDQLRTFADASQTFSFPLVDENGATINSAFTVVTGANGNGIPEPGSSCNGWSSPSAPGTMGGDAGDGDHMWARAIGNLSCSTASYRLYCFGVDYAAPLTLPVPAGAYKRAFASTVSWTPSDGGSIGDADALCTQDAVTFGLCASAAGCAFRAVLTPNGATAQSRFADLALPVVRAYDHVRVASSATNFFAGVIEASLGSRLNGGYSNGYFHWTGGTGVGSADTTCNGWSARSSGTGTMSQINDIQLRPPATASTQVFDSLGPQACTQSGYLMCME
jgi:hypothetical protein